MNPNKKERSPLRILSLEDSPRDFEIIRELLTDAGHPFRMDRVETRNDFISALKSGGYDLVLADFKLPGFDAFAALELTNAISPQIPFICVSGSIGEETAIELIKRGAVDYVLKDRPERLPLAVNRALEEAREKEARRRAEEALRLSEQKFQTAFQSSPTAITITTVKDGLIVEANEKVLRLTGYEREEVIGHTFRELGLWVDNAARNRYLALLQEQGRVVEMEVDFRIKSGEVRNCLVSGALIEIEGQPHILGATVDITERKQAEEALRESEKKYRQLFESIVDVYYQTDQEGSIVMVSPSVEKLLGYVPAEVIGKKLSGFYI
ncbi:MAG: PAS domain S-box protein, partial [Thermodesulfobacteriota bacterium]